MPTAVASWNGKSAYVLLEILPEQVSGINHLKNSAESVVYKILS